MPQKYGILISMESKEKWPIIVGAVVALGFHVIYFAVRFCIEGPQPI